MQIYDSPTCQKYARILIYRKINQNLRVWLEFDIMVSYLFIQTPLFGKFGFIVAIVVVHNQHMSIYNWEIEYGIL